jgi:hypothetical protein
LASRTKQVPAVIYLPRELGILLCIVGVRRIGFQKQVSVLSKLRVSGAIV